MIVSYFQAGRICDYIQEPLGRRQTGRDGARVRRSSKPTPEVIQQTWACRPKSSTSSSWPGSTRTSATIVANFDEWRDRPERAGANWPRKGSADEVIKKARRCARCIPSTSGTPTPTSSSPRPNRQGRQDRPRPRCSPNTKRSAGAIREALKKLASLRRSWASSEDAPATLDAINDIYPVNDEDLHRRLGDAVARAEELRGRHPRVRRGRGPAARSTRPARSTTSRGPTSRRPARQGRNERAGVARSGARLSPRAETAPATRRHSQKADPRKDNRPWPLLKLNLDSAELKKRIERFQSVRDKSSLRSARSSSARTRCSSRSSSRCSSAATA